MVSSKKSDGVRCVIRVFLYVVGNENLWSPGAPASVIVRAVQNALVMFGDSLRVCGEHFRHQEA